MEQFDEDSAPFWLQNTDNSRHHRRPRRQSSHLFFNTGILIILLLAIAFAFIFIIIPSFQSLTSKVFKPQSLKKSWDSINLVLVLFAVICAFLSKTNSGDNDNNETPSSYENYKFSSTPRFGVDDHVRTSNLSTSGQWFYDRSSSIDRTAYNSLRRMRSSSSYPDLRQESTWMVNGSDDRWRFNDDSGLYDFRSRSRRERDEEQVYFNNLKDIAVDTVHTTSPPRPPSPPPQPPVTAAEPAPSPPPPQPAKVATPVKPVIVPSQQHLRQNQQPQFNTIARRKPKRTYEDVKPNEVVSSELKMKHSFPSSPPPVNPPASPPLSSPPPSPPIAGSGKRGKKTKKKKGGVTKDFLISLTRKKKHQRQRSVENLDEFFNLATLPLYPPPSPPPPPPPPLPSFYNIFSSKKSKARKQHSIPPPPPPLPPPSMVARASKIESNKLPVTIHKHQLPVKIRNVINVVEESVESGNESPFHTIPPPPPPPPFKMPPWKFEVHGDYVRLKSINSSRSGSPDLDDPLSNEASPSDGNHGGESTAAGPLFCPSPDVNTKADNFIARFRAGLNLEKINSVKGRSNLGLDPGPSTV